MNSFSFLSTSSDSLYSLPRGLRELGFMLSCLSETDALLQGECCCYCATDFFLL